MDTFDSRRSTVPARLPGARPGSLALRTSAGMPASGPATTLSMRVVVRGARRYWWLVLMLWVVGSASIGILIYLNIKPSYRAISLLRVDPEKQNLYNVTGNGEALEPFLQTQVQLITSPNVLTAAGTNRNAAALPRIQKAGDVVQELRKAVNVAVIPGTYLIEVSMTSNDGAEAATIVNAVVDAFTEANSEWSNGMTRVQIQNLEGYKVELSNKIEELERKWKELRRQGQPRGQRQPRPDRKKEDGTASKQDRTSTSRSTNTGRSTGSSTTSSSSWPRPRPGWRPPRPPSRRSARTIVAGRRAGNRSTTRSSGGSSLDPEVVIAEDADARGQEQAR